MPDKRPYQAFETVRHEGEPRPAEAGLEGEAVMDYRIELTTTRPPYGGVRWWFICPRSGRRVMKLHLPRGGRTFAARQFWGLPARDTLPPRHAPLAQAAAHAWRRRGLDR